MISSAVLTASGTLKLRQTMDLCVDKTRTNIADMVRQPTSWALAVDGDYAGWDEGFFEIGNWTSGFISGMAVLAWRHTGDDYFLRELHLLEPMFWAKLEGENAENTMHDLGFLYSPYAVALYENTGGNRCRELGLNAAGVLLGRFISAGGYFRAWGRMDEVGTPYDGLAIIDSLMNMPLLYWASRESGDSAFAEAAFRHTETTLKHFVRNDGSVYHSYRFGVDGSPSRPDNYCGRGVETHWARGSAWAMYGFALAYRHTGDERFLEASQRVTAKFISLLDEEVIPLWDFKLDDLEPRLRDASAASIAVCALQELEALGKTDSTLNATRNLLLSRLCSADYLDTNPSVRGIQKFGEVGDGVGRAKHAYTSWGDYYLMEGVARELGYVADWW